MNVLYYTATTKIFSFFWHGFHLFQVSVEFTHLHFFCEWTTTRLLSDMRLLTTISTTGNVHGEIVWICNHNGLLLRLSTDVCPNTKQFKAYNNIGAVSNLNALFSSTQLWHKLWKG
jgi:hypothetical protein